MATVRRVFHDGTNINIIGIYPNNGIMQVFEADTLTTTDVPYAGGIVALPIADFFMGYTDYFLTIPAEFGGTNASIQLSSNGGDISVSDIIITEGTPEIMATGSGREYTASQRAHTVGQRYFDIKGNGPTEDNAIIELGRKIALIHGSVVLLGRPRISVVMADADFDGDTGALGVGGYAARVAARDSAGEQENVQITLEQTFDSGTIDERVETVTVRIPACSDSIKLAGTAVNDIDPANAKVTAFVTAYHDSDGNNGYQFRSGKFVR